MQAVACVHDTEYNVLPMDDSGTSVGSTTHDLPFHLSARGRGLATLLPVSPLAMHDADEVQDTPLNRLIVSVLDAGQPR
jgi:hypothetical protein